MPRRLDIKPRKLAWIPFGKPVENLQPMFEEDEDLLRCDPTAISSSSSSASQSEEPEQEESELEQRREPSSSSSSGSLPRRLDIKPRKLAWIPFGKPVEKLQSMFEEDDE